MVEFLKILSHILVKNMLEPETNQIIYTKGFFYVRKNVKCLVNINKNNILYFQQNFK